MDIVDISLLSQGKSGVKYRSCWNRAWIVVADCMCRLMRSEAGAHIVPFFAEYLDSPKARTARPVGAGVVAVSLAACSSSPNSTSQPVPPKPGQRRSGRLDDPAGVRQREGLDGHLPTPIGRSTPGMNHRIIRGRAGATLGLAAVGLALVLTGCGSDGLSDGDTKACAAAVDENPQDLYGIVSLITNEDILKQAQRVKPGSSDSSDTDAMAQIVSICEQQGWQPPCRSESGPVQPLRTGEGHP
ncbi:hypothetical protein MOQ72_18240 [Saccharopolyspora sp. K220]|uniref:hypothetical protein n=1 Tax=Saccharopolyspora soli TaxID=2926618 RepID=UPI001F58EF07|nr:hypothetical protein [Saccharopolyspora soli]MCI2419387.1 hypothetical protein [Saccharopolyspora soli]